MKRSMIVGAVASLSFSAVFVSAQAPKVDLQKLGLDPAGAPSVAAPAAAAPVSDQASILKGLLQQEDIPFLLGETGYDALRDLFRKGQAPTQADLTGSFSGQIFEKEMSPDQGTAYGLVGKEVAGALSQKFELVFNQERLKSGDLGDLTLSGEMPDYNDTYAKTTTQFGDKEAVVQWKSDMYMDQIVKVDLKVRKVGQTLVAVAEVERHFGLGFDKPLWVGYFSKR